MRRSAYCRHFYVCGAIIYILTFVVFMSFLVTSPPKTWMENVELAKQDWIRTVGSRDPSLKPQDADFSRITHKNLQLVDGAHALSRYSYEIDRLNLNYNSSIKNISNFAQLNTTITSEYMKGRKQKLNSGSPHHDDIRSPPSTAKHYGPNSEVDYESHRADSNLSKSANESNGKFVNPHPFEYLINNPDYCREVKGELLFVVYVHSAVANYKKRMVIRATWGNPAVYAGVNMKLVFVMGKQPPVRLDQIKRLQHTTPHRLPHQTPLRGLQEQQQQQRTTLSPEQQRQQELQQQQQKHQKELLQQLQHLQLVRENLQRPETLLQQNPQDNTNTFQQQQQPLELERQQKQHKLAFEQQKQQQKQELYQIQRDMNQTQKEMSTYPTSLTYDSSVSIQRALELESAEYGDIIQESFMDTYRNLTYKGIAGLRWVSNYCSNAKYVVKTDDDIFVNSFSLVARLKQFSQQGIDKNLLQCLVWRNMVVMRTGKWKVNESEWQPNMYPPYCSGSAFYMSMDVAQNLHSVSYQVPFFWVDDLYITGLLAQRIENLTHTSIASSYVLTGVDFEKKFTGPTWRQYLFSHVNDLSAMVRVWKKLAVLAEEPTTETYPALPQENLSHSRRTTRAIGSTRPNTTPSLG